MLKGASEKTIIAVKIMEIIESYKSRFRQYLVQLGYSKSTTQMLPELVSDFLRHTSEPSLENINAQHIQRFYEWLEIRPHKNKLGGLSEQYINHHIYALRTFFNWLETTNQIEYNPISSMKFKSPKSKVREPLTREEIQQLFEATTDLKEIAILHLFYSCGLRRSEGEALNKQDVHVKQKLLYVRKGKGAKCRVVPMTEKVSRDLQNYLEACLPSGMEIKAHDHEAFILNKIGNRMSGDSYNKVLKQLIERTDITKETSLHHLRHSIATHLLESGLTVEYVRDFLGHAHLESTQIYTKVSKRQIQSL
jgi:integrase/recombinase XerD